MPSTIEQLSPSATKEILSDPKIHIFTVTDSTQKTVDVAIDNILATQTALPEGEAWRVVYDVSHKEIAWTPYFRKRAQELATNRPDLFGRYAVVVQDTFFGNLMQLFLQINLKGYHRKLERRVFFNREEAIKWVGEYQG